jgi:hypothetical protein
LANWNVDLPVKSPKTVMPDLRSLSRTAMRGHPEVIGDTGFSDKSENDVFKRFSTCYETINVLSSRSYIGLLFWILVTRPPQ